jgi:hypothetical protein
MKLCLDLFCGMGGWSIGFYREGYRCVGVDVVDVGYPYELVLSDVRDFHPADYFHDVRPKVVVASPPCTEFSTLTKLSHAKGQRGPPDPLGPNGIGLVREAMRIKDEARPDFWVLENVWGSRQYIEPLLGPPILVAKPWVLWGNLPPKMFEFQPNLDRAKGGNVFGEGGGRIGLPEDFPFDPLRSWKRARIPVWLAQSIARMCDAVILERGGA